MDRLTRYDVEKIAESKAGSSGCVLVVTTLVMYIGFVVVFKALEILQPGVLKLAWLAILPPWMH